MLSAVGMKMYQTKGTSLLQRSRRRFNGMISKKTGWVPVLLVLGDLDLAK